ncbi:hypothetical protein SDC9_207060 [bioreactor metagenome]|uniref:Uncharacterized protein n=1 Tax=bioreactor metagenome TaxID=1076179 RepID=A0A645J9E6_9ZZZZ
MPLFLDAAGHILNWLAVVQPDGQDLSVLQPVQRHFGLYKSDRAYHIGNVDGFVNRICIHRKPPALFL